MKRIVVGIIGSGFAAELHVCAYQKVCGLEVVIKAVWAMVYRGKHLEYLHRQCHQEVCHQKVIIQQNHQGQ